jgi:hypothetical protein
VYGPVPPEGIAVALPVELPLQSASTFVVVAVNGAEGWVMVTLAVVVQLLASLTVTVYVPAGIFNAVTPVWAGTVFHEYVYGEVPPTVITVALPVEFP